MAKQNQHIEEYLDAYRKMKDADFAVMIAGPWGCGKTHFVRDYLDRKCTPNGKKEYSYVSLNAVNTVPDISLKLFGETVRLSAQKGRTGECLKKIFPEELREPAARFLRRHASSAAHILKGVAQAKLNVSLSDLILVTGLAEQVKGSLLIFDDLERCILSPEEILGYINNFVEHSATKVVIIGEEDHLNKGSDEKYRAIKEKVIGKTFRLTERIGEIFDDLISEKSYPKTHEIILRNKAVVINLFQKIDKETKRHNYRALKHCFRDFDYFYPKIDPRFCEKPEFPNALFRVFVTLDYELQLAHFPIGELRSKDPADYYVALMHGKDNTPREKTAFEQILERHDLEINPIVAQNDLIFLENLWGRILGSEQVDKQEIEEVVKNSSYFISKSQPEWVSLWHWRRIEDDDAEQALKAVREKLAAYEYRSREVILHVFAILLGLVDLKAIPETKDEILEQANQYLADLAEKKFLAIPARDTGFHWVHHGALGLGYWSSDLPEFQNLVSLIDEAVETAVESDKQESVPTWLAALKNAPEEFLENLDSNGRYYRDPILKYFQPAAFIDAVIKIPNENLWMVSGVLKRRYDMYGKDLAAELPFCEGVVQELGVRLDARDGCATPSSVNWKYLKEELEKVLPVLRNASEPKDV